MKIGFTGTQQGMTVKQKAVFRALLPQVLRGARYELHHGDCVGADTEAAEIAREEGYWIVGHPPINNRKRANFPCDELRKPEEYLVRNRHIVEATVHLFATPKEMTELLRSGTWSTIRYARSPVMKRHVTIILPNGDLQRYNPFATSRLPSGESQKGAV